MDEAELRDPNFNSGTETRVGELLLERVIGFTVPPLLLAALLHSLSLRGEASPAIPLLLPPLSLFSLAVRAAASARGEEEKSNDNMPVPLLPPTTCDPAVLTSTPVAVGLEPDLADKFSGTRPLAFGSIGQMCVCVLVRYKLSAASVVDLSERRCAGLRLEPVIVGRPS